MKHHALTKSAVAAALSFALSQPAFAVTDEEFRTLQEQFNQLADQVEDNSKSTSHTTVGGYGELHYNNLNSDTRDDVTEIDLHRF
ncbi:MAG: hypothetical protein JKX75_07960, partial [Gammaproteobacteria bacterium]|nr:hypothetical protein [Gammaproteobacteria bacterium]